MNVTATYLDKILDHHRAAARGRGSLDAAVGSLGELAPTRPFAQSLTSTDRLAVIAEVKRRSPSKGSLGGDLDPAATALRYVGGGAAAVSVLTDAEFFGGSAEDLGAVRSAVDVPVLRKDFTVSPLDVVDARAMGADAVLLIVAALDDAELTDFAALASDLDMGVLVEVHDEAELERALARTAATVIGVNQRDLVTFEVDSRRAIRVKAQIPDGCVTVAESGVRGVGDATQLAQAGFDAILVGEHVVTSDDPAAAVAALGVPRPRVERAPQ